MGRSADLARPSPLEQERKLFYPSLGKVGDGREPLKVLSYVMHVVTGSLSGLKFMRESPGNGFLELLRMLPQGPLQSAFGIWKSFRRNGKFGKDLQRRRFVPWVESNEQIANCRSRCRQVQSVLV